MFIGSKVTLSVNCNVIFDIYDVLQPLCGRCNYVFYFSYSCGGLGVI